MRPTRFVRWPVPERVWSAAKRFPHLAHGGSRGSQKGYVDRSREAAVALRDMRPPLRGYLALIAIGSMGFRPRLNTSLAWRPRNFEYSSRASAVTTGTRDHSGSSRGLTFLSLRADQLGQRTFERLVGTDFMQIDAQ